MTCRSCHSRPAHRRPPQRRPPRSDEWREFVDAIPQHWMDEVSRIAVRMSEEWRKFADRLDNKIAYQLGNKMEAAS